MGGNETSKLLSVTAPFCQGVGVDFGCEIDPVPNAYVLVDGQRVVHSRFAATHEVHIRNIDKGFSDWKNGRFDFAYSSHLIEHLRDPFTFLQTCARITKIGGYVVVVGPHEDWYWPNGHPDANPDHRWWHLNPRKIMKWLLAVGKNYPIEIVHVSEHGRDEDNWSWVVAARRIEQGQAPQHAFVLTPDFVPAFAPVAEARNVDE